MAPTTSCAVPSDIEEGKYARDKRMMTPELLQEICEQRHMWAQPHLNTQLFLNNKGFDAIEGMEEYVNVRHLNLDNNNIGTIEGLERMSDLRNLQLAGNRLLRLENLHFNVELRHLNLESNGIKVVSSLRHLTKLETLNLANNRIEKIEDIAEIKEFDSLVNVDVSGNQIESTEGVVEFWTSMPNVKVLRYHGNPGIRMIDHYRKRLINGMPNLTYLDERPVFPIERKGCEAWATGGMSAMHKAKQDFQKARHEEYKIDPERARFLTERRNAAIARIKREEEERKAKEEAELATPSKLNSSLDGSVQNGDLEALEKYEKAWKQKADLHGLEEVRKQASHNMTANMAAAQSAAHRTNSEHVDPAARHAFDPPSRHDFAPPPRSAATEESTASRRSQDRIKIEAADFTSRSRDTEDAHASLTDRQIDLVGEYAWAGGTGQWAKGASKSVGSSQPGGFSQPRSKLEALQTRNSEPEVIPDIWKNLEAQNAIEEAKCLDMNLSARAPEREVVSSQGSGNELSQLD